MMLKRITGWHVLALFGTGFGIIIAVNLTLAVSAVRTFPGLEVKNSYVASQTFDADRAAQEALEWDVSARLERGSLWLSFDQHGAPVQPEIVKAVFGRPTATAADQEPVFAWTGSEFVAPLQMTRDAAGGNWDLWIEARADNGTLFKQRLPVEVAR
jgi:nitrogen fixation protein FixH